MGIIYIYIHTNRARVIATPKWGIMALGWEIPDLNGGSFRSLVDFPAAVDERKVTNVSKAMGKPVDHPQSFPPFF